MNNMNKRTPVVTACLGIVLALASLAAGDRAGLPGASGGDEMGLIERSIRDCIGWAKTKDFKLLYGIIANDADFLEVHPDGAVVKGFEEFRKAEAFWGSPDFKAVRYDIRDLRIKLSKSGDVAWFFCILDDINEWKGRPANWENTRWTGVLEKRDGRWVMVQQHFSFAQEPPGQTDRKQPLDLVFIANCGIMVTSGEGKVLVDALFDKPNPEYRAPSAEVLDRVMKAEPPYDGVDLVLVTHNHPDHFDAALAARYLEKNPGPVLLAPADAVAEVRKAAVDWPKIEARVVSLDLKVGEKAEKDIGPVKVKALRTLHSGDREAPVNLMFLFELGGRRVWHEGDSTGKPDVYRGFGLGADPVDLAVVHFWFPLEPNCARFLQEVLKPGHIALTHLPIKLEGDAPGKIDLVEAHYKDLFLMLPGMPARTLQSRDP